jgi:hypothetical protein
MKNLPRSVPLLVSLLFTTLATAGDKAAPRDLLGKVQSQPYASFGDYIFPQMITSTATRSNKTPEAAAAAIRQFIATNGKALPGEGKTHDPLA